MLRMPKAMQYRFCWGAYLFFYNTYSTINHHIKSTSSGTMIYLVTDLTHTGMFDFGFESKMDFVWFFKGLWWGWVACVVCLLIEGFFKFFFNNKVK